MSKEFLKLGKKGDSYYIIHINAELDKIKAIVINRGNMIEKEQLSEISTEGLIKMTHDLLYNTIQYREVMEYIILFEQDRELNRNSTEEKRKSQDLEMQLIL